MCYHLSALQVSNTCHRRNKFTILYDRAPEFAGTPSTATGSLKVEVDYLISFTADVAIEDEPEGGTGALSGMWVDAGGPRGTSRSPPVMLCHGDQPSDFRNSLATVAAST